jgi:ribosome maturation factor RimP
MKREEIENLVAPVIADLGLECLGIEFVPSGGNALLRIYIDVDGRLVTIEDCEAASREVSATLDVNDPIGTRYTLEVSSPGIERPLFKPAHYQRFVGSEIKLETHLPVSGRRRWRAKLAAADDTGIVLLQDGVEFRMSYTDVLRARLVDETLALPPAKPGKSGKPGKPGHGKAAPKGAGKAKTK